MSYEQEALKGKRPEPGKIDPKNQGKKKD